MQEPKETSKKTTAKTTEQEDEVFLSPPLETEGTDIAQTMGAQLDAEENAKKKQMSVQSEQIDALLKAYKDRFGEDDWYKKHPPEVEEDGSLTMHFKSFDDLADFSKEQAEAGVPFTMVDKATNKVMAYSNGDGKLYNGDGTEFKAGQKDFIAGDDLKNFKMPAPTSSPEPTPDDGPDEDAEQDEDNQVRPK
jgi:hypothetical protein